MYSGALNTAPMKPRKVLIRLIAVVFPCRHQVTKNGLLFLSPAFGDEFLFTQQKNRWGSDSWCSGDHIEGPPQFHAAVIYRSFRGTLIVVLVGTLIVVLGGTVIVVLVGP